MAKERIYSVQIDPVVALKISNCYNDDRAHEEGRIGNLTGYIDQNHGVVEVTHSFETPEGDDDDDMEASTRNYRDYLKYIRDNGCDHLQVGWYTSSLHSEMFAKDFLSTLLNFQMNLAESIVLVYDPLKTAQGMLSFRAFRITQRYLDMVKYDAESGELDEPTLEEIRRSKLMSKDIFEEIPVALKTSHLANMLIFDLEERNPINPEKTVLEPATSASLERHMKLLDKLVDEVANDSNRFNQYQKMLTKNSQQRQNWISKRKVENDGRRQNGQDELPLDEVEKLYKTPEAPNRVEPMLRTIQLQEYTEAVNDLATKSLGKLFITSAFQKSS
jgi:translation initiation factor 3 subunit H